MTVEERLREASTHLRIAIGARDVPRPRFASASRRRRVVTPRVVIGVVAVAFLIAVGVTLRRDPDSSPKVSTIAPPTTSIADRPDTSLLQPDILPKLTGSRLASVRATLGALKLNYEMSTEAGGNPDTGRIVAQDPPPGTSLSQLRAAKGMVRLTLGAPLAVAHDEIDVGLTGDSPQGPWRVVASEGEAGYCVTVFNQDNTMSSCVPSLTDRYATAFGPNFNPAIGVYAGTAAAGTATVDLVDASNHVAATATISSVTSSRFNGLIFWAAVASEPNLTIWRLGDPARCVGASGTTVTVPDGVGQRLPDAIALMRDAGLDVIGKGLPAGDPTSDDAIVRAQEPPPGTSVSRGDCVGFRTGS